MTNEKSRLWAAFSFVNNCGVAEVGHIYEGRDAGWLFCTKSRAGFCAKGRNRKRMLYKDFLIVYTKIVNISFLCKDDI